MTKLFKGLDTHEIIVIKMVAEKWSGPATPGKSLELEQPQYFVDGRGTLQAKKGR